MKKLVQDIESSGSTHNEFNLHMLVEDRIHTCGEVGSGKQHAVQKKVETNGLVLVVGLSTFC
jgi:hypothetical protein